MSLLPDRTISAAHRQLLGLQFSLNCPAACRSCVYECGPRRSRVMSASEAKNIIDSVDQLTLTDTIAFTGGEPFLHLDLLEEVCRYVKDRCGYKISISTNCFWAGTPDRAGKMLQALVDLGLSSLLISIDDFHLEYINARNVENAAGAALELGLKCHLQCVETRSSHKLDYFKKHLDVPDDSELVRWGRVPCDPVGRAAHHISPEDLIFEWRNSPGVCSMLRVWIVDPDGWVTTCCGTAANALPIGNAFSEKLPDIANRANADPVLNALAAWGGPYLLLNVLAENGLPDLAGRTYTSPCHACDSIFRNQRAMETLRERLRDQWLELLAARLISQKQHQEWWMSDGDEPLLLPAAWNSSPQTEACSRT